MANIFLPVALLQSDTIYQAILQQVYYMGILPIYHEDETTLLPVDYIFQSIFPKLISDSIQIEGLTCWVELPKSHLDQQNLVDLTDNRTLRDYVLNYYENDTTCLIKVSHCELGMKCAIGSSTSVELYNFLDKYANETLSNVFVEKSVIESKISEYVAEVEL